MFNPPPPPPSLPPLQIVLNEDRKSLNGLLLIHLPDGPCAQFRLSNLKLGKDIKVRQSSCPCHPVTA